ncbi:hypothetical protein JTB14_028156 [Gonioctena quinquepunctata]|nr:hypothetical protein JTB14_028156 [Gonioctena quinquepunctata]
MQATESQQNNSITNINNRKLDLVITNCKDCIVSECDQPLVNIDAHYPALSISLNCRTPHINNFSINAADANKQFDFRKANFPVMYALIRTTDWRDVAESSDVDSAYALLYQKSHSIFSQTAPLKTMRIRQFPPGSTPMLLAT